MRKSTVLKQEFIKLVQAKIGRLKAEEEEFKEMLRKVKERKKRSYLCEILCFLRGYKKSAVLWDMISCSVIQVSSRFREEYCFHLQCRRGTQSSSITLLFNPETLVKHTALLQIPENTTLQILLISVIILLLSRMCYKKHSVIVD
jgi:hypothetical protein